MEEVSRRGFLGGTAVVTAGLLAGSLLGCSQKTTAANSTNGNIPAAWDDEYDVVVCGAGGTGLAAACAAASAGADVMVFEKTEKHGGTTALSGGVLQAAGTKWQKQYTTFQNDTPAIHAACYLKQSEGNGDEGLINTMCEEAPKRLEWLSSIGIGFTSVYGNCHVPYCDAEKLHADRIHVYDKGGAAGGGVILTDAEYAEAQNQGAQFTFNAPVKELIIDEGNRVLGIKVEIAAQETYVRARKGVILGLGGIDRNESLAQALNHQQYWDLTTQTSYISNAATGDGIRMGMKIDAALATVGGCIDYDMATGNATSNHLPLIPCVFVNEQGRRFVCEDATYAYTYRAIFQQCTQNDGTTWMVMDQNMVDQGVGAWTDIEKAVTDGDLIRADTYEELATKLGIPVSSFVDTMDTWNTNITSSGADTEYGRTTQLIRLDKPPYLAHENKSANLGSLGGLKIDESAQVYDNEGNPIEHLYAGGMNSGGWYGLYYPGSGTSLTGGLVWGWIAGTSAAANSDAV